jgi:hypothetical protein
MIYIYIYKYIYINIFIHITQKFRGDNKSWPLFQKSQLPRILHPVSAGRPLALHPATHWAAGNVARTSPAHRARGPASAHQDFPGQRPTRRRLHLGKKKHTQNGAWGWLLVVGY